MKPQDGGQGEEEELSVRVSPLLIVFFVFCMCSMLLLLYFFFDQLGTGNLNLMKVNHGFVEQQILVVKNVPVYFIF